MRQTVSQSRDSLELYFIIKYCVNTTIRSWTKTIVFISFLHLLRYTGFLCSDGTTTCFSISDLLELSVQDTFLYEIVIYYHILSSFRSPLGHMTTTVFNGWSSLCRQSMSSPKLQDRHGQSLKKIFFTSA